MITRIWHGRTLAAHADEYLDYIRQTGLAAYRAAPGNISARILRKKEGGICHFYTVSEWDNLQSIIGFAGTDFEKATYYEQDKQYLLELEENVNHYETFV